jgi:hypothetical protein
VSPTQETPVDVLRRTVVAATIHAERALTIARECGAGLRERHLLTDIEQAPPR